MVARHDTGYAVHNLNLHLLFGHGVKVAILNPIVQTFEVVCNCDLIGVVVGSAALIRTRTERTGPLRLVSRDFLVCFCGVRIRCTLES